MWRIRSVSTESSSARFADGRLRHASEPLGDIFNTRRMVRTGKVVPVRVHEFEDDVVRPPRSCRRIRQKPLPRCHLQLPHLATQSRQFAVGRLRSKNTCQYQQLAYAAPFMDRLR